MDTAKAQFFHRTAAMIALELQPETVVTKGDISATTGVVTLGVPQGGSSSPPLYNVYMDTFCKKMESELRTDNGEEEVDVSVFADDVKIRSKTPQALQKGLNACTEWASEAKMKWSARKCHVLEPSAPEGTEIQREYFLSGERIKISESALYLGVTLRGTSIATDRNQERIQTAFQRIGILKSVGINRKFVPSSTLIKISRTYVYPIADYALHLMPLSSSGACALSQKLELLDYRLVEFALGCIAKDPIQRSNRRIGGRLPRHLKLARLPDWLQRVRMRLHSLGKRLRERALQERRDFLAREDPVLFRRFRFDNRSPSDMTRKEVCNQWSRLCRGRRRPIPMPDSGFVPILHETNRQIRDSGIKWYCGSFPGNPDRLQTILGMTAYTRHKVRIQTGMQAPKWSASERQRTIDSITAFTAVLEGTSPRGAKRKRVDVDGDTPASKHQRHH